jgi:LmbE family N-acetylglucosaminyl deacetylase
MANIKALCLVAHPDDCVIFGLSYIHNHPEIDWTIGYLTYTAKDPRGAELAAFWRKRNIDCVFLGFVDDYRDLETKTLSFDAESAAWDLQELADHYDLVLTHDEHGDYGHLHHVFVHNCVRHHPRLITFARPGEGITYTVPPGTYSLEELPQHGEIIASFHRSEHKNSYKETK